MHGNQSIMEMLRHATKEKHDRLETTPFFVALQKNELPKDCYIEYLHDLSIIHGVLEHKLSHITHSAVRDVWSGQLRKFPLLQKDIKHLSVQDNWYVAASTHGALVATDSILLRFEESPVSLLGYLYVLEGSTRGSVQIRSWIEKSYAIDASNGCAYFTNYGEELNVKWGDFSDRMNQSLSEIQESAQIIEAACECYGHMDAILRSIYPPRDEAKFLHVTSINPEAGNHPIPDNPLEIQAALGAADLLWRKYPYYQERYGERGKRFARSDCAWLITLCDLDSISIQKQTQWLAGVLAARGMPTPFIAGAI